jgi:predicted DCC family thiol-disulfide oxidoreductase YuxK
MGEIATSEQQALVLYDGLCGFCNWNIQWVLAHDRNDRFRFAPQQSALAESVLAKHGVDREAMISANSVYLVLDYGQQEERLLSRSDVPVEVLRSLDGRWRLLGRIIGAVPKFLRDMLYGVMARNRFRISRRLENCPVPSAAQRAKFLV